MSMIRSITMDGQRYTFYCDSWNTRHGFAHGCEMFGGGGFYKIAENKCYYLNRTWEMWTYQCAIAGAVINAIDHIEGRVADALKEKNGWSKLTVKRREAVMEALDHDTEYQTLTKVLHEVNSRNPAWD